MSIQELAHHPEDMNRETLYELRRLLAAYPYYQPARMLMLKNLYIMHDPSFDEELRRAAMYITDRKVLFNLVEAAHYQLKHKAASSYTSTPRTAPVQTTTDESRTVSLIDNFLNTIPKSEEDKDKSEKKKKSGRKPTAADATVDYVAYLLSTDFEELEGQDENNSSSAMNGGDLIDAFINNGKGRIVLQDKVEYVPELQNDEEQDIGEEYITETLAGIYIKQGRFEKALDILNKLDEMGKKSPFYDDQQRFLKKLISLNAKNPETSIQ
jgi:tetratricopeptide (TPR) repeat protein